MHGYKHSKATQLAIYALVGFIQLACDVAILQLLIASEVNVIVANYASRLCAALVGFFLHRHWTFKSLWKIKNRVAFAQFVGWWLMSTLIGGVLLERVAERFGYGLWMSGFKILIEALTAIFSFLIMRHWIFRGGER